MSAFKSFLKSTTLQVSHSLPQMAAMGKTGRTAQSKASAKKNPTANPEEAVVLRVEGSSKVVEILTDGVKEYDEVEKTEVEKETKKSPLTDVGEEKTPFKEKKTKKSPTKGKTSRKSISDKATDSIKPPEDSKLELNNPIENQVPSSIDISPSKKQHSPTKKKLKKNKGRDSDSIPAVHVPITQTDASASEETAMDVAEDFIPDDGHIPRCVIIKPQEVPNETVLASWNTVCVSYDQQKPPVYHEGDMLWAKVSGHPYWPCMVAKCPFTHISTRIKGAVAIWRLYHVQFFGDEVERGWISEPSLLKFEGKSKFLEIATVELAKHGKKATYNPFRVKDARLQAWEVAVAEAEEALPLSIEDRVKQYKFDYLFLTLDDLKKKKNKDKTDGNTDVTPKPGKKRKRESDEDSSPNAKRKKTEKSSKKSLIITETSFDEYYANHHGTVLDKNPEWTLTQAYEFLKLEWDSNKKKKGKKSLPESPRPKKHGTLTMKHFFKSLHENEKGSKRGRKPSAKLLQLITSDPESLPYMELAEPEIEENLQLETPSSEVTEPKKKRGRKKKDTSELECAPSLPNTPVAVVETGNESEMTKLSSKPAASSVSTPKLPASLSKSKLKQSDSTVTPELSTSNVSTPKVKKPKVQAATVTSPKAPASSVSKPKVPKTIVSKPKVPESTELKPKIPESTELKPKVPESTELKPKVPESTVLTPKVSKPKASASTALTPKLPDSAVPAPKLPASAVSVRKSSQDSDSSSEMKGKGLRENEEYELEIFKLYSTFNIHKDCVCAICEKNGDAVLECSGSCNQHFHLACVGLEDMPKTDFKCSECTSGTHACFECKKTDGETKKCTVPMCGKYYHEDCVKQLRLTRTDARGFVCPMHTCVTCAVDNVKNPKACKGRLFKCVRCPTAYHVGDLCIAAGSVVLGGYSIICSNHFQPKKALSMHSRVNITWCFTCSKGGNLLCCESCPASFHADCVKVEKTPDEAWYCADCEAGSRLLYGNIVWIKVGNYRWWPGEICHPRNVPDNIRNRKHQVGEFPCRFFGSHDYYWLHHGRVFLFQEGDKASKDNTAAKGLFKAYSKGVTEATAAFKLWTATKAKKEEQEQERSDKKPAPYKSIKTNFPIGNVQIIKAELSDISSCECRPNAEDPCSSDCLNRMVMYECHPSVCAAGDRCCNQRFQKRQYPDCSPFKCEGRGWGLRCNEDIKKGQFVAEYVGDLIDEEECKRRIEQAHDDNISNFYMLTMDKNRIIDAGPKGNFSRFMNHSCCPNLETQKWMVNGDIRVGLFTLRDITKGEELTFNYNLECIGNEKKACCCGADNCSGFLGVRPKTAAAAAQEKRAKEAKKTNAKELKKKKKKNVHKVHEDDCFRCGWGGELVMCDKGNCPKVYHLQCLKLTKPPMGKWLCPWHHCDDCGKIATSKCSECPNSYCSVHTPGNVFSIQGILICSDHGDLLGNSAESLNPPLENPPLGNGVLADTAAGSESDSSSNIAVSNSSNSSTSIKVKTEGEKKSIKAEPSDTGLSVKNEDNGDGKSSSEVSANESDLTKVDHRVSRGKVKGYTSSLAQLVTKHAKQQNKLYKKLKTNLKSEISDDEMNSDLIIDIPTG